MLKKKKNVFHFMQDIYKLTSATVMKRGISNNNDPTIVAPEIDTTRQQRLTPVIKKVLNRWNK